MNRFDAETVARTIATLVVIAVAILAAVALIPEILSDWAHALPECRPTGVEP